MTTELRHEIEIDAPPAVVWSVLTDTANYPDWNPFVRRLEGTLAEGERLEVEIAPPGGKAMTFRPTVLAARPGRELRWLGRLLLPGLFDGEHAFTLEPLPDGRTRFVQSERFRGILVRPLRRTLAKTRLGFERMDEALKAEAEARADVRASA
jgi:hypothetical protein